MLVVALVGKPNVGKSTLFNRIIKKNVSIVDDFPGVTRDRIYGEANWLNRDFQIIDTGGLTYDEFDFKKQIEIQVNFAIEEADIIVFLTSIKEGINQDDLYISKLLKKHKGKKIILAVNKIDNKKSNIDDGSLYKLGFGNPIFISSEHGIGIGDLLDLLISNSKQNHKEIDSTKFCIIGKPNVGKSSLVNCILNEERMIVSDISGTTRDAIDSTFKRNNKFYTIIDTAGIKRKGKIKENIDKYSFIRVEQAISRSNIIVLVLDATQPFSEQDEVIAGLAYKANIPTIIVINKWDSIEKDSKTMTNLTKEIKIKFQFISWAPIIFLSAKENKRVNLLFDKIEEIKSLLKTKISSLALTESIAKYQMMNNAPSFNGGRIKISYVTQVEGQIPTFVLFCNNPQYLHFSYARYLENELRETFGLKYIPITLYFKAKKSALRERK